ncbi:MAG: hypothetical protein AAB451_04170 [Patescibacteria group bacterium]
MKKLVLWLLREYFSQFGPDKKLRSIEKFIQVVRKKRCPLIEVKTLIYIHFLPNHRFLPYTTSKFPFIIYFSAETPWGREIYYEEEHTQDLKFDAGYATQKVRNGIMLPTLNQRTKELQERFPDIKFSTFCLP